MLLSIHIFFKTPRSWPRIYNGFHSISKQKTSNSTLITLGVDASALSSHSWNIQLAPTMHLVRLPSMCVCLSRLHVLIAVLMSFRSLLVSTCLNILAFCAFLNLCCFILNPLFCLSALLLAGTTEILVKENDSFSKNGIYMYRHNIILTS